MNPPHFPGSPGQPLLFASTNPLNLPCRCARNHRLTAAAEKSNAENLLVNTDKATAGKSLQNWQDHQKHSEP
jgi:hypothetical protein